MRGARMVTCLNCRCDLDEIGGGQFRCRGCHFVYPGEVLWDVNEEEWAHIQDERLFCLDCEQVLPGLPRVHVDKAGNPVPCPVHDRRARRAWWRRVLRIA